MSFVTDWKPVKDEDPKFNCRYCGEFEVEYREWESSDGGHEDTCYQCTACKQVWWVEGSDA